MEFGIGSQSVIPIRRNKSERGELTGELLFGELYKVLEHEEKWIHICALHDGTQGWIDAVSHRGVSEEYAKEYLVSEKYVVRDLFALISEEEEWVNRLIPAGSLLPFYNSALKRFDLGDSFGFLRNPSKKSKSLPLREQVVDYAFMYYNTPYLWGGRTPAGIDNLSFIQTVLRLCEVDFPRDIELQKQQGAMLSFLEEALPGDLAFFGDNSTISHVGLIWEKGRIIHASGRVRVDKIDHHGIFNEESKRYTHSLKMLINVLD